MNVMTHLVPFDSHITFKPGETIFTLQGTQLHHLFTFKGMFILIFFEFYS